MKKTLTFLTLCFVLLLSACSQTNTNEKVPSDQDETEEPSTDENSSENESDESTNDKDNQNDHQVDELTQSDEQDYAMLVLPEYSLTSEEPGKDALYATEDSAVFMRIETANEDELSFDTFKNALEEMMKAVSSDDDDLEEVTDSAKLPTNDHISDVVAYQLKTDDTTLFGYVFRTDQMIVRLTVFDSLDEEHIHNFIEMASTIQSN